MKFALFLFTLFVHSSTFASGANGSGGGMGVVCRNVDGTVRSVELLDLWEARTIYNRSPLISQDAVSDQVDHALKLLENAIYSRELCEDKKCGPNVFYNILKSSADRFFHNLPQFHRMRGVRIAKTDDAFEIVTPSQCTVEQVVRWQDTPNGGDILIDQDLVDFMDKTNEAALYVHEALYTFLRNEGETSSLRVRRAVGLAFNGYSFENLDDLLPAQYYECRSEMRPERIFIYESNSRFCNGGVQFQLVDISSHGNGVIHLIGYENPSICVKSSIDQIFNNGTSSYQGRLPFGLVGFDYTVYLQIGGFNGERLVQMYLMSSPEGQIKPHLRSLLKCNLVEKNQS